MMNRIQEINCVHNGGVMELMRGLRLQIAELITGLHVQDIGAMSLGLSHSLSRFKLKFSPDKVCVGMCVAWVSLCLLSRSFQA